ncbi:trypsin-7-like [Copidosoma floridanum]|uniref:trypsin-7-like n=1 Tax=Copidosoma floridanum TaxID=29053 RepID=UPI0006C9985C|nr:trypsin-7-like [Copidosoma floridanum]
MNRPRATVLIGLFLLASHCACTKRLSNYGIRASSSQLDDDGRVVGGYRTTIYKHPYQVSVRYGGRHRCGGAIIAEEWLVTAAHCVRSVPEDRLSIRAGSTTLRGREGQARGVKEVIVHEDYSQVFSDYDIALVRLSSALKFGSKVGPIELSDDDGGRGAALVVGWGVSGGEGKISNVLREAKVPLISNTECSSLYRGRLITERMLCAGYVGEGGRDACQGDSGGPLVQGGTLIGIVSWGIGCAGPYQPGVYTRVAAFRSWIGDIAGV